MTPHKGDPENFRLFLDLLVPGFLHREGFRKIGEMNGNPKILIFTESKDALEYLVRKIRGWGYKVTGFMAV